MKYICPKCWIYLSKLVNIFAQIVKCVFGEIISRYLVYVCHSWLAQLLMWKLCQMASFISHSQQLRISFGYFCIWCLRFLLIPLLLYYSTHKYYINRKFKLNNTNFGGFQQSLGFDKTFIVGLCCCIWGDNFSTKCPLYSLASYKR